MVLRSNGGAISDAKWLADPHERGKYSVGDGRTTFRVPDRNGVQSGSFKGLFGRGDSGVTSNLGRTNESSAPNLTAYFRTVTDTSIIENDTARGAGYLSEAYQKYARLSAIIEEAAPEIYPRRWNFDASRQSSVYGRYGNTDEITPNNFTGVWVIRASGGFVAANTSWSVINGDATRPTDSTRVESGKVSVEYKIGTAIEAQGKVYTAATMGGTYSTQLSVKNATTGKEKDISVTEDGDLWSDRFKGRFGTRMAWSQTGWVYGTFSQANQAIGNDYSFYSILSGSQSSSSGYKTHTHIGQIHNDNGSFADSCWHVAGDDDNKYGVRLKIQPNNNSIYFYSWWPNGAATYTLQLNAISDSRLKHDIKAIDATKSIEILKGLEFQSFVYNNDEKSRIRRGVIAQQVETIEPLYVKTRRFYNNDGVEQEQKELDTTPMLLDTMHVVQELIKRIESLEEELKQLRANLVQ